MDGEKERDLRVPLISSIFCFCVFSGGILLILYLFFPTLSQPWYPAAALVLIGSPWLFWLFTYLYSCMKGCCGGGSRQNTRNAPFPAMQNGNVVGRQQSTTSSRNSEVPLTSSV